MSNVKVLCLTKTKDQGCGMSSVATARKGGVELDNEKHKKSWCQRKQNWLPVRHNADLTLSPPPDTIMSLETKFTKKLLAFLNAEQSVLC